MHRNLGDVSTKQQRIAMLAKQSPQMGFTSLAYLMDIDWLREAYKRTKKEGAAGVDGQTAKQYGQNLEENLKGLLDRAKSGTYRAPPVRRAYIPKGDSTKETRPIGIPTFEDKILQRGIVMLLEPIYETDFYSSSYGCRPKRSAHQALESLRDQTMNTSGCWILEVDFRKFFDTLDHAHLRQFLKHRVRDGVVLRLIGKWLKAGVMEEGKHWFPDSGTPQGGVISPLLANVYLHYVLDDWFERRVKPRLQGRAYLIRYVDDFVMGFTHEQDARRVEAALPKRVGEFGLAIHPEKTRLILFHRPPYRSSGKGGGPGARSETFDLLGFTHYWGRSRKGNWVIKRKTTSSRMSRGLRRISQWCRTNLHRPIKQQHVALSQKLRGHCAYYGITANGAAIGRFRTQVLRIWKKWLSRRNPRRPLNWAQFNRLLKHYPLPGAVAVHSVYRR